MEMWKTNGQTGGHDRPTMPFSKKQYQNQKTLEKLDVTDSNPLEQPTSTQSLYREAVPPTASSSSHQCMNYYV